MPPARGGHDQPHTPLITPHQDKKKGHAGTIAMAAGAGGCCCLLLLVLVPMSSEGDGTFGNGKCYKYTGGTCFVQACFERRNATCSMGRCYCESGCVGSDGNCRNDITEYKQVAKGIRLQNVAYDDQYAYTPHTWFMQQIRTAGLSYSWYGKTWDVYEQPGKMWTPEELYGSSKIEPHGYFFVPTEYQNYAAGIAISKFSISNWFNQPTMNHDPNAGVVLPIGSQHVVDVYNLGGGSWKPGFAPFDPEVVHNSVCKVPDQPGAIQIRGGFGYVSWYEHMFSWEVFGWAYGDPGNEGYWFPKCYNRTANKWKQCDFETQLPHCPRPDEDEDEGR